MQRCHWTACQLCSVSTCEDQDPLRLYHMWPGQGRADSEPKWRLHRGPHDSGRPVTDEPLNRSWQRLVEWGAGAKQERFNRILSVFKTRHLRTHLNLNTNDWKTDKRFLRLTKRIIRNYQSLEATFPPAV